MLHDSMKAEPDLQMALINPRVTKEKKYTLLVLASGLDPEATTLYTRFLRLLLDNHRENQIRMIIFVYQDLYREHHGMGESATCHTYNRGFSPHGSAIGRVRQA